MAMAPHLARKELLRVVALALTAKFDRAGEADFQLAVVAAGRSVASLAQGRRVGSVERLHNEFRPVCWIKVWNGDRRRWSEGVVEGCSQLVQRAAQLPKFICGKAGSIRQPLRYCGRSAAEASPCRGEVDGNAAFVLARATPLHQAQGFEPLEQGERVPESKPSSSPISFTPRGSVSQSTSRARGGAPERRLKVADSAQGRCS